MRDIQKMLGHKSSKTPIHFSKTTEQATERYTHITKQGMSKVRSSLDNLEIDKEE